MWARCAFESESLDRFGCVGPVLQLCFCVRTLGHDLILPDQSIAHDHIALRISSDVLLVRDHDDRDAALVELLENGHDLDAGSTVEIAGRFICQQDLRIIDQRARNCDALLLTAGKLTRKMVLTTCEPDRCEYAIRFFAELRMCQMLRAVNQR